MITTVSDGQHTGTLSEDSFLRLEVAVLAGFAAGRGSVSEIADEVLAYACELSQRSEFERADLVLRSAFETISDEQPHAEALLAIELSQARLLVASGSSEVAASVFAGLIAKLEPGTPLALEAAIALAHLRANAGRFASAATVLEKALEGLTGIQKAEVSLMAAECRLSAGHADSAYQLIRPVVEGNLPVSKPVLARARVLFEESLTEQGHFEASNEARARSGVLKVQSANVLDQNLATYVRAWNVAAQAGVPLMEVLLSPGFEFHNDPAAKGKVTVFDAWRLLQLGQTHDSVQVFRDLRSSVPSWSLSFRSQSQMALEGQAYAEATLGNYGTAADLLGELAGQREPTGLVVPITHIQGLVAQVQFAYQSGKSNPVAIIRRARRQALSTPGQDPRFLTRIMDFEAELLTEAGSLDQALSLRNIALGLLEDFSDDCLRVKLAHEVGVAELTAKLGDVASAELRLELLVPRLIARFGDGDSLTAVARYALISARSGTQAPEDTLHQLQQLRRDLESGLGPRHVLSLKAGYGVGRNLQKLGLFDSAAEVFAELSDLAPSLRNHHDFLGRISKRWAECLYAMRQFSRAAEKFGDCIDRIVTHAGDEDSRLTGLRLSRADSLAKSGQYKEARKIFRHIWQLLYDADDRTSEHYVEAVLGNAKCLERLGNYKGAAFNLARVVHLAQTSHKFTDSEKFDLYLSSAWNLEMAGDRLEAAEHYELAAELLLRQDPSEIDQLMELRHRVACCRAGAEIAV